MTIKSLLIINILLLIALCASALTLNDISSAFITPSDSADGPIKMLMKFDIPDSIDDGCYIEHAEIVIAIEPVISDIAGWENPPDLKIYSVNTPWTPGTANWGAMKYHINRGQEICPEYNTDDLGYIRWDITDFVRSWALGSVNHGLVIMPRKNRDVFQIHPLRPPHVVIDFFYVE